MPDFLHHGKRQSHDLNAMYLGRIPLIANLRVHRDVVIDLHGIHLGREPLR
jgi:hypothetical protein